VSSRIQEVAERANVPEDFVRQLVAAGALPGDESELEVAGAVLACPVAAVLDSGGAFGRDDPYAGQSGRPVAGLPRCAGDGLA
jgi:hypothetical protein